jgi:Alkylmercury lyase
MLNREPSVLTRASLHHAILRHFVDHGHAPSHERLTATFGVDVDTMTHALRDLAAYHGVVLHPHAAEVWVAHPFSTAPTTFTVRHEDRLWWGNCAWCSLGIASLLGGRGVTIDTTLGAEGRPVAIHVEEHRVLEDLVVHFPIPMARAWDNVIFTCALMLVFEDEQAIDAWSTRHALPRGDAQPIQTAYEFAREWYRRHLEPDWRKWSSDEARSLFERFGFRGPIWDLPRTSERF